VRVVVFPDGSCYREFRAAYPELVDPWDPKATPERPTPKEVDLDELALGRMLCAGDFDYQLLHHARQRKGGADSVVLLAAWKYRGFGQR